MEEPSIQPEDLTYYCTVGDGELVHDQIPGHVVHAVLVADLLVRSPSHGYWVRHHHGPLHQVLCCAHTF